MIVEDKHLNLKNYNAIALSDPTSAENQGIELTVINGAQTLTSSANFFYTEKNIDKAKNNAYVMLKDILLTTTSPVKVEDLYNGIVDKITVSLNKQKPIKQEDMHLLCL